MKVAVNLPAGDYAVYCLIPSPDGSSHAHKGMLKKLTVMKAPGATSPIRWAQSSGRISP